MNMKLLFYIIQSHNEITYSWTSQQNSSVFADRVPWHNETMLMDCHQQQILHELSQVNQLQAEIYLSPSEWSAYKATSRPESSVT